MKKTLRMIVSIQRITLEAEILSTKNQHEINFKKTKIDKKPLGLGKAFTMIIYLRFNHQIPAFAGSGCLMLMFFFPFL